MKALSQDVVVIGAGIIGTSCALALQQAGLKVMLLEREEPGAGASSGNAGHIATEQVFPLASAEVLLQLPKMLADPLGPLRIDWRYLPQITPWMLKLVANMLPKANRRSADALSALNSTALEAWEVMLASIGRPELLQHKGALLVYEKAKTGLALQAHMQQLAPYQVPVSHLDARALQAQAPALSRHLLGALEYPGTAHVGDPLTLLNTLFDAARARGMEYRRVDVRGAHHDPDGVVLQTDQGALHCQRVLVANGPYAKPLVRDLSGISVPLETERGYHLMLPHEQGALPLPVSSAERRFIMTPLDGGLRLAGTVEFAGLEREADMRRAQVLRTHANALFEKPLDLRDAEPWMGRRPSLPDSLPVIDAVGPKQRVLLAFGHQHLGLTQAAISAQLIVKLCLGQGAPFDITPYRLARFGEPLS